MDIRSGRKVGGTFIVNDASKLASPGIIGDFLREVIQRLGMTSLGNHIYDVPMSIKRLGMNPLNDEGGITGVAVLSTSHVAIHTWPEECGATFDIHSCRNFNSDIITELLKEKFSPSKIDIYDLTFSLQEKLPAKLEFEPEKEMDYLDKKFYFDY